MLSPPIDDASPEREPPKPLIRFAVSFLVSFPLSFLAYGLSATITGHFLGRRPDLGLDSTFSCWPPFVALHLALWCTPFIALGICLRKRLGRACLTAIAIALLLTALLDGGHLVRRAYEGKF